MRPPFSRECLPFDNRRHWGGGPTKRKSSFGAVLRDIFGQPQGRLQLTPRGLGDCKPGMSTTAPIVRVRCN